MIFEVSPKVIVRSVLPRLFNKLPFAAKTFVLSDSTVDWSILIMLGLIHDLLAPESIRVKYGLPSIKVIISGSLQLLLECRLLLVDFSSQAVFGVML